MLLWHVAYSCYSYDVQCCCIVVGIGWVMRYNMQIDIVAGDIILRYINPEFINLFIY